MSTEVRAHLSEMIWQVVATIPHGRVASYGQIARLCGFPRHARYVGATLKQLPEDSELPWHRVINAKGEVAFRADSEQRRRQIERLRAEGIAVSDGRVSLPEFGWQP